MENEGNSLKKIQSILENTTGDIDLKVSFHREGDGLVYMLFCNDMLSYYLSLELKEKICYIDKLDSTGYVKGIGKDFVKAVLSTIKKEILCCFSHPKPSFIFKSTIKPVLNSFELASFWIEVLSSKCQIIKIWSNRFKELQEAYPNITMGYPFESVNDLVYFEDDPKSRVKEHLNISSIENLFEVLLCRNDFIEGSLVYGINRVEVDNGLHIENSVHYPITEYLLKLDLSTNEKTRKESQILLEKFNLSTVDFKYKKKQKGVRKKEDIMVLPTKRRKK